ncbi:MAG: bifunctional UDP-N-acetylglucosamine diphosphorylase/glucosamine-1-phosphate N-acetyltransferase GlmU [Pseudomonadales bacterium]|nr:bifunctional UDP-N-acetylglucosamine diphosphorylase/glucosamine-1-phosphate N-acetyltransferase GlmU [Pseudomonadales bacterium]
MHLDIVILAAGKGSRMRSQRPKVLQQLAGKPLLQHVIDSAACLENSHLHIVYGHGAAEVQNAITAPVNWCLQAEQLGTGHAVQQAMPSMADDGITIILYGDVPLVSSATMQQLIENAQQQRLALLTICLDNPRGYGRIVREQGNIVAIVEEKDASAQQQQIQETNTGIMAVETALLKQLLPQLSNQNAQGEYYLTDIIALAVAAGVNIASVDIEDEVEVQGVNDKQQLAKLERAYQQRQAEQLMQQGATVIDPSRLDIRGEIRVAQDVTIDANVILQGEVELGSDVVISANCIIGSPNKKTVIGAGTQILPNSIVEEGQIGESCQVGPFARIRPGTVLANGAKVGNFVETKKASIGAGSKVNHLSYIGDSTIGEQVNIGAGTITCNYDGVNKHQTVIDDHAFIGSNTALVAPVQIGETATVAAGSTITKDVAAEELALARGKQKNLSGWVRPKKKS